MLQTIVDVPAPKKRRVRSRFRRGLRMAAVGCAATVLLAAGAIGFAHTDAGKSVLRSQVEKALSSKLKTGKATIGDLDFGMLFSDLSLKNLVIEDASGRQAISLGSLLVDVDAKTALDGTISINVLSIDRLGLKVVENADGTTNLSELFAEEDGAQKPMAIELRKLTVNDLSVDLTKADGSHVVVEGVDIGGSAAVDPIREQATAQLDLLAAAVNISMPDKTRLSMPKAQATLQLKLADGSGSVSVDDLSANTTMTRPDGSTVAIPVSVASLTASSNGKSLDVSIESVALGAVKLAEIAAHGELVDGVLVGQQHASIRGLIVDASELNKLVGQDLLASDIAVDAEAKGSGPKIALDGSVRTDGGVLTLTGNADVASLAAPVYSFSMVGDDIDTTKLVHLPADQMPAVKTSMRLAISGSGIEPANMNAAVELDIGPTVVGALLVNGIVARAKVGKGKIDLDRLSIRALGVEVDVEGTADIKSNVTAAVKARGNLRTAALALARAGIELGDKNMPMPESMEMHVVIDGNVDSGNLNVSVPVTRFDFAGGDISLSARATLARQPGQEQPELTSVTVDASVNRLQIAELAAFGGGPSPVHGMVDGRFNVSRVGTQDRATYEMTATLAEPNLAVDVNGDIDSRQLSTNIVGRRPDGGVVLSASAEVPLRKRGDQPELDFDGPLAVELDVAEQTFAQLVALVPAELRKGIEVPKGAVAIHAAISGTPSAPSGRITVDTRGEVAPGKEGKVAMVGTLKTAAGKTSLDTQTTVRLTGISGALAELAGTVDLGPLVVNGTLDPEAIAKAASLDFSAAIPSRALASLSSLAPALADLPGTVGGEITIRGSLDAPAIAGGLAWEDYATLSGTPGRVALSLGGNPKNLETTFALGRGGDVTIAATVVPDEVGGVKVSAKANADGAAVAGLLPAFVAGGKGISNAGTLDWNMDAEIELVHGVLATADLRGDFAVTAASFTLPGTERTYRDIAVRMSADDKGLHIAEISAHETDIEKKDRNVAISGDVAWNRLKPSRVQLDIRAGDWLLHGPPALGEADAPRASLDADIGVDVDLTGKRPSIDAVVRGLALKSPERYLRGHGLESGSVGGDVIFVDEHRGAVGQLPVGAVSKALPAKKDTSELDVRISIPNAISVNMAPMTIEVLGDMVIAKRGSDLKVRGAIDVVGGALGILGHDHKLKSGRIEFTDDKPDGYMALAFHGDFPVEVMRDISKRSTASGVDVTIAGGFDKPPELTLKGSAGAALFELMAMHNAGRGRFVAHPDMPASATVQAPRGEQPLVLTFLADNLPHMLFLDRFSAWADPYDPDSDYGQVKNFRGDAYAKDNKSRVRALARPETEGRSTAELHYDRLLINDDRKALGVGVRAGSRLGGGVGMFFEWSSED